MDHPLPFTKEAGAGLNLRRERRRISSGSQISRGSVEAAARRWAKSAEGPLLELIGDRSNQNVPTHPRWARGAEEIRPSIFEFFECEIIKSREIYGEGLACALFTRRQP